MDPQRLLGQFLGSSAGPDIAGSGSQPSGRLHSGLGGMAGGLAAGGLIGLLLGNKKARKTVGKLAGGAVGYGGAAVLGALAYRAYTNWQNGQNPARAGSTHPMPSAADTPSLPPPGSKFEPAAAPAKDGRPFELALIMAMIAAANADGHIGPEEQRTIFDQVAQLPLDAEDKAFVFDTLSKPPSLRQ